MAKKKCECAYQYCCDHCWRREAKAEPCQAKGCKNPRGHGGEHGAFNNTGVITITKEEILGWINADKGQ